MSTTKKKKFVISFALTENDYLEFKKLLTLTSIDKSSLSRALIRKSMKVYRSNTSVDSLFSLVKLANF